MHDTPAPSEFIRTRAAARTLACAGICCLLGLSALGLTGCRKPLFNPDAPRSQYDRTDALREQRAPSYVEDEFGFRKPNIRGRLLQAE